MPAQSGLEPVAPKRAHPTELDFLIDGKTTIDEVQAALGEPSRRFEQGRILSYRLDKHYEVVPVVRGPDAMSAFWIDGRYSLILVFDDGELLEEHRLIRVR